MKGNPGPPHEQSAGDTYGVAGGEERKCPSCRRGLALEDAVCPACGFDLKTGKKPVKVYEPLERRWESGLPHRRRMSIFLFGQGLVVVFGLVGALLAGEVLPFLGAWAVFTGLLAFLLGTYDRIDLTRNKRGKVALTRTWRFCFVSRPPETINLTEYEAVTTGYARDVDIFDWIVFAVLLVPLVIPGVVWWFYAIHRDSCYVALCKDHGYAACTLYRGWNQELAHDIAKTLRDVGRFPAA